MPPPVHPAALRNRDAILEVLKTHLPEGARVLEIASGSGEHALHVAAALPGLAWRPTEAAPEAVAWLAERVAAADLSNLAPPLHLDARDPGAWPDEPVDAVVCVNMIHIAPWSAAEGLMTAAGRLLSAGGLLYLYGPFLEADTPTAPSNLAFDADLRARDAEWGLRTVEAVVALASRNGLRLEHRVAMPANNLSLVFRRA